MTIYQVFGIAFLILAVQAIIWLLIYRRLRALANAMRAEAAQTGETLVITPERAYYQGWTRRFGGAKSIGAIALTDRRLIFRRPVGAGFEISLTEIVRAGDTATLGALRHTARQYLVLTLTDGTEVVFIVRSQEEWLQAITARCCPPA